MEGFDTEKAARVWQRVQGKEAPAAVGEGPAEVLFQTHALAGQYLGLQRRMNGKAAGEVRELYRRQDRALACLKGIWLASGRTPPKLPPMTAGTGTARSILEGCAHRERRLRGALERLADDAEHGKIYGLLAQQAAQRQMAVLEILGELDG